MRASRILRPVSDNNWGKGDRPVINISWDQAKQYVDWLARITGKDYRLLTEAEWEYAARAGTITVYSFGDDERKLCKHANLADQSLKKHNPTHKTINFCGDGHAGSAPVGSYKQNAFGLHDMHGNVFEWTADCYLDSDKGYSGAPTDGTARRADNCQQHVIRGGGWNYGPSFLRAAYRVRVAHTFQNQALGFRVARSLLSPKAQ